jgi:hypothetical protein
MARVSDVCEEERGRESQWHFIGDEELRRLTMAGGHNSLGGRTWWREMRSSGEGKGGAGGLTRFFKGQRRRGEEGMAGVLAINGRRVPAAYCLKEGKGD